MYCTNQAFSTEKRRMSLKWVRRVHVPVCALDYSFFFKICKSYSSCTLPSKLFICASLNFPRRRTKRGECLGTTNNRWRRRRSLGAARCVGSVQATLFLICLASLGRGGHVQQFHGLGRIYLPFAGVTTPHTNECIHASPPSFSTIKWSLPAPLTLRPNC